MGKNNKFDINKFLDSIECNNDIDLRLDSNHTNVAKKIVGDPFTDLLQGEGMDLDKLFNLLPGEVFNVVKGKNCITALDCVCFEIGIVELLFDLGEKEKLIGSAYEIENAFNKLDVYKDTSYLNDFDLNDPDDLASYYYELEWLEDPWNWPLSDNYYCKSCHNTIDFDFLVKKLAFCREKIEVPSNHTFCKLVKENGFTEERKDKNGEIIDPKKKYYCNSCKESFIKVDRKNVILEWRRENRVLEFWIGDDNEKQIYKKTCKKFDLSLYKLKELINKRCATKLNECGGDYMKLKEELKNLKEKNNNCCYIRSILQD